LEFQKNNKLIFDLVKKGVLVQVNMGSLTGEFGKNALKTSFNMLENDCIHFIASDSHNTKNRRPPSLNNLDKLFKELGGDIVKKIFYTNQSQFLSIK
jgi:protein-tyrosine phosphatase